MTVRLDGLSITWLGYATARIAGGAVVYTDPGRYGVLTGDWPPSHGRAEAAHPRGDAYEARDGDVVLVTHDHHYDPDGVRRVAKPGATVVVYEGVSAAGVAENSDRVVDEPETLDYEVIRVGYGDSLTVAGVDIDVVPAYNRPDGPWGDAENGEPLHPRGFGCGFRFVVGGVPAFWPGDSDVVPEHRDLDRISLFLPPIGAYTMDRHDAAGLADELDPDLVVPIHYNTFEALAGDSAAFAADVAGRSIPVALDERGHAP